MSGTRLLGRVIQVGVEIPMSDGGQKLIPLIHFDLSEQITHVARKGR